MLSSSDVWFFFLYPQCCFSQVIVRFSRSEAGVATLLRCAVGCTVCGSRSVAGAVLREPALLTGIQNHIFCNFGTVSPPPLSGPNPHPPLIIIILTV